MSKAGNDKPPLNISCLGNLIWVSYNLVTIMNEETNES